MKLRAGLIVLVSVATLLVGCGGGSGRTKLVTRQPEWNYQAYDRIAVVPVKTGDRRAVRDAERLTAELTSLLAYNGAFEVVNRAELASVFAEQDLASLQDVADPSTAVPSGMIRIAQAMVVGRIHHYDTDATREQIRRPRYARDSRGRVLRDRRGKPRVVGHDVVNVYRHTASVGGNVQVIDVATGETLFGHTTSPIELERKQQGAPPSESPRELASLAADELAQDFYTHIAPVSVEVKFKKDMLVVGTGYFDGRYDESDKLSINLDSFMVAAHMLPKSCDRNTFRVAVAEKDGRANLFQEEFVWSAGMGRRGVAFELPMGMLTSTGAREFVAKLYVSGDDEPALEREFELDIPERDGGGDRDDDEDDDEDDDDDDDDDEEDDD